MKPLLAITMGDINGIGPEILVKALARGEVWSQCQPLVVGSHAHFQALAAETPGCPPPVRVGEAGEGAGVADAVPVLDTGIPVPPRRPGVLDGEAGRCAIEWVRTGVALAMAQRVDGLVTCPLNKVGIHRAGYAYQGHTDFIAELTGSPDYRMCLFAGSMRVVHISSHCSLRAALDVVTQDRIADSVRIASRALAGLGLARRHVAVAGLNPHAGEEGAFGLEEQERIAPAVAQCLEEGLECSGPHPPDTVFLRMWKGEFDAVVAMYHDQGHIPMKLIAMDEGVNVTLGIPIVRTSVDHGTAYDIAGTGKARETSLCAAIELAAQFYQGGWTPETILRPAVPRGAES